MQKHGFFVWVFTLMRKVSETVIEVYALSQVKAIKINVGVTRIFIIFHAFHAQVYKRCFGTKT